MLELENSENGQRYRLSAGMVTIGRSRENTIVLSGSGVSRQHARLERNGNGWRILDLDSSNGTFVNGQRVQTRLLKPGDRIGVGHNSTLVISGGPSQPISQAPTNSPGNHPGHSHQGDSSTHLWIAALIALAVLAAIVFHLPESDQTTGNSNPLSETVQEVVGNVTGNFAPGTAGFSKNLVGKWVLVDIEGTDEITTQVYQIEMEIFKDMTVRVENRRKRPGRSDRVKRLTGEIKGDILDMHLAGEGKLSFRRGQLRMLDEKQGITLIMDKTP